MKEIELKAHVADPVAVEQAVRSFAEYCGESIKRDIYWKNPDIQAVKAGNATIGGSAPHIKTALILGASVAALALAAAVLAAVGASREAVALIGCIAALVASGATIASALPGEKQGMPFKIRLREENGTLIVTYKHKELRDSIEINDETEFAVSDRFAFEALITDLGFTPGDRKEKRTKSFAHSRDGFEVHLELSEVEGLGWFLELEILSDSAGSEIIEQAGKTLRNILARCGVPESAIETRYYTELLSLAQSANRDKPFCQEPKK